MIGDIDGRCMSGACRPLTCFTDTFAGDALDPTRYEQLGSYGATVSVHGGLASVQFLPDVSSAEGGFYLSDSIDLEDGFVSTEIFASDDPSTTAWFVISGNPFVSVRVSVNGGVLEVSDITFVGGGEQLGQAIYEPVADRFIRYRDDATAQTISVETSPDNGTWSEVTTFEATRSVRPVRVMLFGTRGTADASAPEISFGQLSLGNRNCSVQ